MPGSAEQRVRQLQNLLKRDHWNQYHSNRLGPLTFFCYCCVSSSFFDYYYCGSCRIFSCGSLISSRFELKTGCSGFGEIQLLPVRKARPVRCVDIHTGISEQQR
jgi:hypothetical protein